MYKALSNILEGGGALPITVGFAHAIERSKFKQSIYPPTFKLGTAGLSESAINNLTYVEGGRKITDGGLTLYPDVGIALQATEAASVTCDSEEVLNSNYIFVRARNAEFNYSTNPSFVDDVNGGVRFTEFITSPQTFITG